MRFGYTILYGRDVAASVEFYERAFGLPRRYLHQSGQYAKLETGATALAFASHELAAESAGELARKDPPGSRFASWTRTWKATYTRAVEAGGEPVSAPEEKPWGQHTACVSDPDRRLIEIASPM